MSTDNGGPAFPLTPTDNSGQIGPTMPGMTLRDWFAGLALAGLASTRNGTPTGRDNRALAGIAYDLADAMIETRTE